MKLGIVGEELKIGGEVKVKNGESEKREME